MWFAKHAGWSGYTTGMAGETSLRQGCWRYPLLSQHVGSLLKFSFLFSCTFFITNITSSMFMMSGHVWFMVVFMTRRAVNSLSVIFPLKKKKCLLVSVRGYCMLHGQIMRSEIVSEVFPLFPFNITWGASGFLTVFLFFPFDVFRHWCMTGAFFRGQCLGE